jgi:hypothetical protein
MVLAEELGPTKPLKPLTPQQHQRVQQLVAQNRGHLHDDDKDIGAKLREKTRDAPSFVKVLLWIVTPPSPRASIGEVLSHYMDMHAWKKPKSHMPYLEWGRCKGMVLADGVC